MKKIFSLILLLAAFASLFSLLTSATVVAQEKEKKVENPINKIINKFLGRRRGMPRPQPGDGDSTDANGEISTYKKDAIDQRAPSIREHQSLLNSARTRIKHKQYPEALEILQSILDQSTESVIQRNDGQFRSVRWVAQRQIFDLPDQAKQFYEKTYGPLAKKMLDEAYHHSNFSGIRKVAERYFHTQAGYEAANRIAAYHVDQGEFAVAAQWYLRLENTTARFVTDPVWKLKVSEVYRQAALNEHELTSFESLTDAQRQELKRRLPNRSIEEIREQWKQYQHVFNPPLADWLFPGGSARRDGLPEGTLPLLMSDWQQEMTEHPQIRQQIDQLLEDLEIKKSPIIPMMQPVTIGNRVVMRTLEGLKAIDVETGRIVWESREKDSPATLLMGTQTNLNPGFQFNANFQIRGGMIGNGWIRNSYSSSQVEQHPLTNLLFRNAVHGTLSSDGQHVFVIERNAVLSRMFPGQYYNSLNLSNNDTYRRDWTSNRLTAYNLQTGKLAWHIGGAAMNEPIDPPLAGTFFFGPALTDNGELFVVGEKENALRVYCLQAATGKVLWSQLLAYTDAPIERDLGRRWWASQPAFAEGVLVCPTNVGLLVGIDRQSHDILWISRYTKKQQDTQSRQLRQRGGSILMANVGTLQDRWFATPPIIAGQTVIYAPLEEASLIGYRLTDGKERWRNTGLKQGLYPLGSYKSDLIVVNKEDLTGYDINTGEETWMVPFASFDSDQSRSEQIPCGRGLIMGNQVMLPIGQQEIWYFDLDKKEFSSRSRVADAGLRLGNLVMAQGKLISAGPDRIAMFQPKDEVEQKIKQRLQENPQDPWSLLKQAKIFSLDHQHEAGLRELTKIDVHSLDDSLRSQYRRQMLECLIVTVKNHPEKYDQEFQQIPNFIETDVDRQRYLRLRARRMVTRKEYASAIEAYAELANFRSNTLLRDSHDASFSSRQDVWLNAQLKELWDNSSGEITSQIIRMVNQSVQQAIDSNDLQQMLHVIRIYGFHPDIEPIYFRMVELATEQKDFATAQFALNTMAQQDDESVIATSIAKRAELLHQFGLHSDALYYLESLKEKEADLVLLDGLTVGEWLQEKEQENWLNPKLNYPSESSWANEEFEVVRIGSSNGIQQKGTVNISPSDLPFFKEHRFLFNYNNSRLKIFRIQDDELLWSIPLQQVENSASANVLPVRIDGHLLTLYYKGMLQCYSLPDQRLVWSKPITSRVSNIYTNRATLQKLSGLHKTSVAANRLRINNSNGKFGPLAISTSHTICYFGRQELVAVDPLNGETRWIRRGIPAGTAVYGDEHYLCILTPNSTETIIISTADGRQIETDEISPLIHQSIAVTQHQMITVQRNSSGILGLTSNSMKISAIDFVTRESLWEFGIGTDDYIGKLDENSLIIVKQSGTVQVIALSDGELLLEGDIGNVKGNLLVFSDANRIFLIVNTSSHRSSYLSIHNQYVNGFIVAIDRKTGEQLWKHATKGLSLILQDLDQIPVLLLVTRKHERIHKLTINMFRMLVLDKQTGKPVFEKSFTTQQPPNQISWSFTKKQIRMHSYNSVYTLRPKQKEADQ